jgi:hypothetical protein
MSDLFTGPHDLIRLDRRTDREKPCCENLATILAGKGPHGAELGAPAAVVTAAGCLKSSRNSLTKLLDGLAHPSS